MTPDRAVGVSCVATEDGWRCRVEVGTDPGATTHEVTVHRADLRRLRPGSEAPDALVHESFEFLLAREPRESILRRFDLTVIARYFPEWEAQIRKV